MELPRYIKCVSLVSLPNKYYIDNTSCMAAAILRKIMIILGWQGWKRSLILLILIVYQ